MKNCFCWMQLNSKDKGQSKSFYKELFSWSFEDREQEECSYTVINTGEKEEGGIIEISEKCSCKECKPEWIPYVYVSDIDKYIKKAEELGAEILIGPKETGGGCGKFSIMKDPEGARIGIYEPKEKKCCCK